MRNQSGQPVYGFIHISKTAGKTVRAFFRAIFGEDAVLDLDPPGLYEKFKSGGVNTSHIRAVVGHVYFPLDEFLPGRTVRHVTLVREPLERFVSFYNFTKQKAEEGLEGPGYAAATEADSISDFYQRFLATGDVMWQTADVQSLYLCSSKACNVEMVKSVIEKYFLVYPVEYIDRMFDRICEAEGIARPQIPPENISKKFITMADTTESFRDTFYRRASLDVFTYYYVLARAQREGASITT